MKPVLPKVLLTALLAAQSLTAATEWTSYKQGLNPPNEYDNACVSYQLTGDLLLNTTLAWPDGDVDGDDTDGIAYSDIYWSNAEGSSGSTLSGTGKLTGKRADDTAGYGRFNMQAELYLFLPQNATIEKGITMENLYLDSGNYNYDVESLITINATLKNCMVIITGATLDLRAASTEDCDYSFSGAYFSDNILICNNLQLTTESRADIYDKAKIVGNVSISGTTYGNASINYFYDDTTSFEQNISNAGVSVEAAKALYRARSCTPLVFSTYGQLNDEQKIVFFNRAGNVEESYSSTPVYPQLTITGTLTVNKPAPVVFEMEVYENPLEETTLQEIEKIHKNVIAQVTGQNMRLPGAQDALIICGSVSEQSVKNLKPFYYTYVYTENQDFMGYEQNSFTALTDKEFYAEAGEDGMVHIYLRDGNWDTPSTPTPTPTPNPEPTPTPTPSIPSLDINPGSTITLGGESTSPTASNPVQMQGGTADASALDNSLLNNGIFKGNSGTVKLGSEQTFTISGSGTLGYNISGGNLTLKDGANMTLGGNNYSAANTSVGAGVLTVGSNATLGSGSNSTVSMKTRGGKLTNYGNIRAGIDMVSGTSLLNEGNISGAVMLGQGATAINNGSLSGKFTVAKGAKAFGSGIFSDTIVENGGFLHIGNSPGFQSHKSLNLQNGATLSFSVDGTRPADGASAAGTHSQMKVESLTMNGTVNVAVDVTTGIVNAGAEPFSIELLKATQTSGNGNFDLQLEDELGLLKEADLSWSGSTLTLNAAVSEEALAMLANQDSVHLANTMWASAAVVQDFARMAESQNIIGVPGQTTWWAGAFGTFQHVADDAAGYTYNSSGYGAGLQHAFNDNFRAGFGLGQSFGTYSARRNGTEVKQMAIMPILTAQYVKMQGKNSFSLNAHLAYGDVENEADTINSGLPGTAEWSDTVISGGIRAAWNVQVSDTLTVSPFIGITYRHVAQDNFTEKYTAGSRKYSSGRLQEWSLPLGVTLRSVHGFANGSIIAPELTVAYVADIARSNPSMRCTNGAFSSRVEGYKPDRGSFMLNAGLNWLIDQNWSFGAFYYLELTGDQNDHSINGSVRYSF